MTRYEYVKTVLEPRFKDEDELYHHGILGMKWGVRRYQNEDGSLTPEGRKRYYGPDGTGLSNTGRKEVVNKVKRAINKGHWGDEKLLKEAGKMVSDSFTDEQRQRIKAAKDEADYLDKFDEKLTNSFYDNGYNDKAIDEAEQMAYNEILENPKKHPIKYSILNDPDISEDNKNKALMDFYDPNYEKQLNIMRDSTIPEKKKYKMIEDLSVEDSFGNVKEKYYLNTTSDKYWKKCKEDMEKTNRPANYNSHIDLYNIKKETINEALGGKTNDDIASWLVRYIDW